MQDYEKLEIAEAVSKINKSIFLPDIQRDFVWKPEQIYKLFDSIMREYPINTMLFWKQLGSSLENSKIKKIKFANTNEELKSEDTGYNSEKEYFLVLDGQQRLTSFNIVLNGNYIIKKKTCDLFYNILSGSEENDEGIIYEFFFFESSRGTHFKEKVERKPNLFEEKIWYRVKNLLNNKLENVHKNVKKEIESNYVITLTDESEENITRLFRMLRHEKLVYYYPEKEASFDKILDIFVRTNSGGTKLTHSDLLFSTIKSKIPEAKANFDELIERLNDNRRYDFSADFIIKTCLTIHAKNNDGVRYKISNFHSSFFDFVQTEWSAINKAISLVRDIIHDKFLITDDKALTSYNALIPLIYFLYKNKINGLGNGKNLLDDHLLKNIGIWFIKSLLTGFFGAHSDSVIYKCKEVIDKSDSLQFPAEDIDNSFKRDMNKMNELDTDFLEKVKYNSKNSYLVLSLLYNGKINFSPTMKSNLPEQDHIIPKKQLKANYQDSEINSIFNIRYVSLSENRLKAGTSFKEWIDSQSDSKSIKESHIIPAGDWNEHNYLDFIEERKKMFMEKLIYSN